MLDIVSSMWYIITVSGGNPKDTYLENKITTRKGAIYYVYDHLLFLR